MSKVIRQTALSGLLGSKRFIVSVCAALAMVLGALSVGASIFVPQSSAEKQERAAQTPVFTERGSGEKNSNSSSDTSKESDGPFSTQHTLIPGALPGSQTNGTPLPRARGNFGTQFGPLKADGSLNLGGLQIKLDTSLAPTILTPLLDTPILSAPSADEPAGQAPTPETTPADEPKTPDADPGDSSPASLDSLSTFTQTDVAS